MRVRFSTLQTSFFAMQCTFSGATLRARSVVLSTGARWRTVGVSDNIIDASFQALMDSIVYKLMKNRGAAGVVAGE